MRVCPKKPTRTPHKVHGARPPGPRKTRELGGLVVLVREPDPRKSQNRVYVTIEGERSMTMNLTGKSQ